MRQLTIIIQFISILTILLSITAISFIQSDSRLVEEDFDTDLDDDNIVRSSKPSTSTPETPSTADDSTSSSATDSEIEKDLEKAERELHANRNTNQDHNSVSTKTSQKLKTKEVVVIDNRVVPLGDYREASKDNFVEIYDPETDPNSALNIARRQRKEEALLTRGQLNKRYVPLKKKTRAVASSLSKDLDPRHKERKQQARHAEEHNDENDDDEEKERLVLLWYAPVLSYSGYGSEALEFISSIWRAIIPPIETDTFDRRPNQTLISDRLRQHSENLSFSLFREEDNDDEDEDDNDDKSEHAPTTKKMNSSDFTVTTFGCFHHGDEQKQKFPSYHTAEFLACRNTGNGLAMASPTIVEPNWHILQPHPSRMIVVCHSNQGMWSLPKSDYNTLPCPTTVHPVLARVGRTMFETDRVPLNWFRRFVQMDELWVPTEFHKETFIKSYQEYFSINNHNSTTKLPSIEEFTQKLRVIPEPIDTELWRRQDTEYGEEYLRMLVLNEADQQAEELRKEQGLRSVDDIPQNEIEKIEDEIIDRVENSFRIPVENRNTRNRLNYLTLLSGVNVAPDYSADDPVYGRGPSYDYIRGVTPERDKDDDGDCDDRIVDLQDRFDQASTNDQYGNKVKVGPSLREMVLKSHFFELNAYRLGDRSSWGETQEGLKKQLKKLKRRKIRKLREELEQIEKRRGTNLIDFQQPSLHEKDPEEKRRREEAERDPFAFGAGSGVLVSSDAESDERRQLIASDFDSELDDDLEDEDLTVIAKGGGAKCMNSRVFISTFKRERRKGWDILVRAFVEQFTSRSKRLSKKHEEAEKQKENRNLNAPCLILHTNEFAEGDLPINFPGTIDLFLEFLYGEIFVRDERLKKTSNDTNSNNSDENRKYNAGNNKDGTEDEDEDDEEYENDENQNAIDELSPEQEKIFLEKQQQEQEREREEAVASMGQLWNMRFEFSQRPEDILKMMQQSRPAVVDRVTAARLALHQRRELLIDLDRNSQHYFELCRLRCISKKNRLFEKVNEDEKPTCLLCDRLDQTRKRKKPVSISERARIWRRLMRERLEVHDAPIVLFTSKPLSFEEYRILIMSSDVNVLTTRGEGWGRPVQESMALAVPSIVTNWSGPASFSHKNFSFVIPIRGEKDLRTVPDDLWFAGHKWAEPSVSDVRRLLVKADTMEMDQLRTMGARAREYVVDNLDVSVVGKKVIEATTELAAKKVNEEKEVVY